MAPAAVPRSAAEGGAERKRGFPVYSVRQVTALIRGAIAQKVPAVMNVVGEVAEFSRPGSGHLYFTLKDDSSQLRCVMWKSSAASVRFRVEAGMEVVAAGGIEVYEPRGAYQLVVQRLEPRGMGALELAFRQLKETLERDGLFDAKRKRPLPAVSFRIALITSPSGAAIRDVIQTLQRRFPVADVLLFPTRVQGDGAAAEIADAIRLMSRAADRLGGIDVAVLTRGGGSIEDLWAFNEEPVARAIAASRVPVVSAVGHEVDVTISDLVADVRAPTPTAAAEMISPVLAELLHALGRHAQRVGRCAGHAVQLSRARLERLARVEWLARPESIPRRRGQQLDELCGRLELAMARRLRRARERLSRGEVAVLGLGSGEYLATACKRMDRLLHRYRWGLAQLAIADERRLARVVARLERRGPAPRRERLSQRLDDLRRRAGAGVLQQAERGRSLLEAREAALRACDPKRVLERGYSITRDAGTGRILRSAQAVRDGKRVETELPDGRFTSVVDDPTHPRLF